MTLPRVTVDANLLASGALRMRPDAAPVRLLDAWYRNLYALVLSEYLLVEVERTLTKPDFVRRLSQGAREEFLLQLRTRGEIVPITADVRGVATHPEDDLILATALSGGAQLLVTGDHRLLDLKEYQGVVIVGAQQFLALLPGLLADDI
jgi:putative PIN family toxin of toxin-antitoxin system